MQINAKEVGNRLKQLRLKKKITQLNLSTKIGVCQEAISSYENGKTIPTIEVAITISQFFSVSLDYLFGIDSIPKRLYKNDLNEFETYLLSCYKELDFRGQEELSKIASTLVSVKRQSK